MTPDQRAETLRLADACMHPEVADLLRELAAEPQRQPLTEGEINAMIRELGFGALTASLVVRATERKHGIGETK